MHNEVMDDNAFKEFLGEIEFQAKNNYWFTFDRRGIQTDIFNAFQRHRSGYFECMVSGPNQIYKSTAAQEIIFDCLTRRNAYRDWTHHPKQILVLTPKQTLQASGFQRSFQLFNAEFMRQNLRGRPTLKGSTGAWAAMNFKNGDQIVFETFDAGVEYIETVSADLVIMDEGNNEFEFYEYLTQRIVAKGGVIYWSMIPGSKLLQVHQKVFAPQEAGEVFDDREVIQANESHYAAIHGQNAVTKAERKLSRRLYLIKICGKWVGSGNLVYEGFDLATHVIKPFEIPASWRRDIFLDWASSNNEGVTDVRKRSKTAAGFIAIPPSGEKITLSNGRTVISNDFEPIHFIYREYCCDTRKTGQKHAQEIAKLFDSKETFQEIIIDCSLEDQVFQEFRKIFFEHGQGYRTYKATNKKRYGSDKAKHLLGHDLVETIIDTNRLYVFDNCKNYLDEILQYEIDPEKQEPQTYADHFMDGQRYYFNKYPRWRNPSLLTTSPRIRGMMDRGGTLSELSYLAPRQEYNKMITGSKDISGKWKIL